MFIYAARLDRVVDADTVRLVVDLGFRVSVVETFRLSGIDAPERYTYAGKAASHFVAIWFALQSRIELQSEKPIGQEKYGRWLGRITGFDAIDTATVLNDELVKAGHAKAYG